jgi:molybdopterin converting factor small subunit
MTQINIPNLLRDLTAGREKVTVEGQTVGDCLQALEEIYPGILVRLCKNGDILPLLAVVVDGKISRRGLKAKVKTNSVIQFVPAISGG